jgi:ribosome recycling factor
MELPEVIMKTRDMMLKSVDYCKSQFAKVRTGRASVSLVDGLKADYYGSPTPIDQMASISVPDARTIMIQPWDRTTLELIEKAIRQADLGFNPQNDGIVIRIPVPPLTEERRKEFVKLCRKFGEEGKVAVRGIRRDQLDLLRKAEKNKEFTEDEKKKGEEEIQKLTDEFVNKIDSLLTVKEKELMED